MLHSRPGPRRFAWNGCRSWRAGIGPIIRTKVRLASYVDYVAGVTAPVLAGSDDRDGGRTRRRTAGQPIALTAQRDLDNYLNPIVNGLGAEPIRRRVRPQAAPGPLDPGHGPTSARGAGTGGRSRGDPVRAVRRPGNGRSRSVPPAAEPADSTRPALARSVSSSPTNSHKAATGQRCGSQRSMRLGPCWERTRARRSRLARLATGGSPRSRFIRPSPRSARNSATASDGRCDQLSGGRRSSRLRRDRLLRDVGPYVASLSTRPGCGDGCRALDVTSRKLREGCIAERLCAVTLDHPTLSAPDRRRNSRRRRGAACPPRTDRLGRPRDRCLRAPGLSGSPYRKNCVAVSVAGVVELFGQRPLAETEGKPRCRPVLLTSRHMATASPPGTGGSQPRRSNPKPSLSLETCRGPIVRRPALHPQGPRAWRVRHGQGLLRPIRSSGCRSHSRSGHRCFGRSSGPSHRRSPCRGPSGKAHELGDYCSERP